MHFSCFQQKTKKSTPPGAGGVPRICFHPKSYFFCELKPHTKFQNPTITPSGRKVTGAERKRAHSARKPLGPIPKIFGFLSNKRKLEIYLKLFDYLMITQILFWTLPKGLFQGQIFLCVTLKGFKKYKPSLFSFLSRVSQKQEDLEIGTVSFLIQLYLELGSKIITV